MTTLRLHPEDNVVIAVRGLARGDRTDQLSVRDHIPAMHKMAVHSISAGQPVIKYRQPIGLASKNIAAGEHVHNHNCAAMYQRQQATPGSRLLEVKPQQPDSQSGFQGFQRDDGRAGTRNYIGVITSVNCSATVARQVVARAHSEGLLADYDNVDDVVALTHGSGCGMQSTGEGFELLKRTLQGYISHPNFAGVLVIGLGCEVMQLDRLDGQTMTRTLGIQEAGGTRAAIDLGLKQVTDLAAAANRCQRQWLPASKLTLALQCGGSDAYSGITANPALGMAADLLVSAGGSAILSETPEIYGAEHLLVERASSEQVARQLLDRVDWWRDYAARNGDTLDSNPSPGNLAGGISTILEKSLGAQAKSGSSPLRAVIAYAEPLTVAGLNFMDSPGFDPASVTGQVAAGANVICFTTGRGSAFGFKPVPSIKLATNSALFSRMADDMDINCGGILEDQESVAQCGERIFEHILNVASGSKTQSEILGYGDNEFTPWQLGAVY